SDITATGKVWDMYSTCTWTPGVAKCGNYSTVCDCYNREHTIPQSWFNSSSPMVSDAFHVFPTDGKVNGQRSNYPFGECANGTTLTNGKGKLGASTYVGYSGTVFEPDNEFKGDMARTYFYFATRYQNIMTTIGGDSFNKTTFPSLSEWSINLFLKWHRQDPVSKKETDRNNAVEVHQKNRNPFIDYPMLAEHIWGTNKGIPWSITSAIDVVQIEFSVSPNPVRDILNIKTDEQHLDCTIYDMNGQQLIKEHLPRSGMIHVSQLQNGMYLIQVRAGNKTSISKFIVNK
ncbi:MAG: endonuclease, partial [Paludibacter sp.]|nr:endonuclease [Paludibacter sp.]